MPHLEGDFMQQQDHEAQYRTAARVKWGNDGECEIDEDATVSVSEDGGAYVSAWVWISDEVAGVTRDEIPSGASRGVFAPVDP